VPNIKSAIKRVKVAERNRQRNRTWRTSVRTVTREVAAGATNGKESDPQKALNQAYKIIDMAVSKGVLHKNAAARRKSRAAKQVNASAQPKAKKKK
jgi:small subunit ribosomal protein S20